MPEFPEVQSEEELASFVDERDTAPYWDAMEPVDPGSFRIRRRSQTAVRVPVSRDTLENLKELAHQRGRPLDDLLREWMLERLDEERRVA